MSAIITQDQARALGGKAGSAIARRFGAGGKKQRAAARIGGAIAGALSVPAARKIREVAGFKRGGMVGRRRDAKGRFIKG